MDSLSPSRTTTKHGTRLAGILVGLAATVGASDAHAVNWEQQAERLARVSATLLDGLPISEPPNGKYGLGLKFDTSFLPKPNTTVGAKKEKVPSSPVHAVPTVKGYGLFDVSKTMKAGFHLSAGYLMPGLEGLMGVKAKLSQLAYGGGGTFLAALTPDVTVTLDAGLHMTSGEAKGAITATDANDTFTFKTMAYYMAPGVLLPSTGLWGNVMFGMKSTEAELKIPSDDTTLKTKDGLEDAPMPVWFQIAAGWRHAPTGLSAGLAYLVVPARLYMPRMHLAYLYPLGGDTKTASDTKTTPSGKARPGNKGTAPGRAKGRTPKAGQKPRGAKGSSGAPAPQEEVAP